MQKVIITGAASGIGLAMARAFAEQGAAVAISDIDAAQLQALPDPFHKFTADIADETQTTAFMRAAIAALDGVTVLVNNAGIAGPQGPIESLPADEWRHCIAVGVHGLFYATRAAVPAMKAQQNGCILNISSTAGTHGMPDRTPYVASKWAIVGVTKALAMELGAHGIRVNALCPGSVAGPRIDRVIRADAASRGMTEATVRAEYAGQMSLRRMVQAADIAATALHLASPAGAALSGQIIAIDGNTETLGRLTRP